MNQFCLEPCLGQVQPSRTGIDYPVRAAVRAGWAPWQWTARTATRHVCLRTRAREPSAGRQAPMMSALSSRMGTIFWRSHLPGTGALVLPAVGPCLPCGRTTSQACLGLCPEKAEGGASGNNSWNSSLAFTALWKRKRVASDGLRCPFLWAYFINTFWTCLDQLHPA